MTAWRVALPKSASTAELTSCALSRRIYHLAGERLDNESSPSTITNVLQLKVAMDRLLIVHGLDGTRHAAKQHLRLHEAQGLPGLIKDNLFNLLAVGVARRAVIGCTE